MDTEEDSGIPVELSNISFQDLSKYTDRFNVKRKKIKAQMSEKSESQFRRENKNRPTEISSKKPKRNLVSKTSNAVEKPRDPRFDSRSGTFYENDFHENYKFLNRIKKKEHKVLSEKLQDPETSLNEREKIKSLLQRQKNQNRELTKKRKQMKLLNEKREFELSQLKQGKKPFYQKKSAQKLLQLAEQFEELKSKGSLGKHMKRHRKKKMIKDKIKMNLVSS